MDEWIKKIWDIYIYISHIYCVYTYTYTMEYSSALKKKILPFVTTLLNLKEINAKWNKPDTEG